MKAVILAGGRGTRLKPLTLTVPKPLVLLGDRPILFYLLDMLNNTDVDEIIITLGYLGEKIEKEVKNYKSDKKISFSYESGPLGTAGAVKKAVKNYDGDVLVLSGDAYSQFDLNAVIRYHCEKEPAATIVTTRVDDPREYGLVLSDENGRITRFIEKPGWSQAITDCANTGVYVISKHVLDLIPDGQEFDFSKNLFPLLLKKDLPMYSFEESGYWCDVGDIASYLSCNEFILSDKKKNDFVPRGKFSISDYVLMGNNVKIGNNSDIGKNTVVCDGVKVGKNARISGSVIYPNCVIGDNCVIENAVLCSGVKVKNNTRINPLCSVGENAVIGENCTLYSGVRVNSDVRICDNMSVGVNVVKDVLTNAADEVSNAFIPDVDCFFALELGFAVASGVKGGKIAVATDGSEKAKALLYAFISGVSGAGAQVWVFGDSFYSQMFFFTYFCSLPLGVFLYCDNESVNVKLCAAGGLPLKRETERLITGALKRRDFEMAERTSIKHPVEMMSISSIYSSVLFRQSESSLSKIRVTVDTENEKILFLLEDSIRRLEGETQQGITLHVSNDGTKVSVTENNIDYMPEEVLSVLLFYETKNGNDVALDYFSPQIYSSVAGLHEGNVYRYCSSSADDGDAAAREKARGQLWTRDALFASIRLLSLMHEENKSFYELKRDVPEFYVSKATAVIDFSPTKLIGIFSDSGSFSVGSEGITFVKNGAKAIVLPETNGKRIRILSEGFETETAEDLCAELIDKINSFSDGTST